MIQIGHAHSLEVVEQDAHQHWLDAKNLGRVPLDINENPSLRVGDEVTVFLHTDPQANPIATLNMPRVQRGECASLPVVDITHAGAFLDWGLSKNLLLPFAEQRRPLEIGRHETVLVYTDNSGRLAASSRLDHHLPETATDFTPWQPVSLLIYQRTQLGLKAVVDNRAIGLLYKDEIFKTARVGESHEGFIKHIRHDGRIDLSLQPRSQEIKTELADRILQHLHDNDGVSTLNDKSSPEMIQTAFQVSKKNFKKALSTLYKERKITIHDDRIELPQQKE